MIRNTKRMFSGTLVLNGNADRQTDDCWPWRESIVAWHKPSETGTSTRRTDLYLCDAFVWQRAESGTRAHARLRRVLRGEGAEDAASCTNTSTALIAPYSCFFFFPLNPEASCLTCSVCVGFNPPPFNMHGLTRLITVCAFDRTTISDGEGRRIFRARWSERMPIRPQKKLFFFVSQYVGYETTVRRGLFLFFFFGETKIIRVLKHHVEAADTNSNH